MSQRPTRCDPHLTPDRHADTQETTGAHSLRRRPPGVKTRASARRRDVVGLDVRLVLVGELDIPAVAADADPDLVVVVGAKHRMPPSLVWELAYSELVFLDTTWQHFGPGHLDEAIGSYAHRHRRFGGID